MPVTCIERTLLAVAGVAPETSLELALEDAIRRRLTTLGRIVQTVTRDGGKGRPGSGALIALLEARGVEAAAESALETKVLRALRKSGLSGTVRQRPFTKPDGSTGRIDIALPEFGIAIEVESYRWHSGRAAWHKDIARRNELIAQGWIVLHATQEDADEGCISLIETVKRLIAERWMA